MEFIAGYLLIGFLVLLILRIFEYNDGEDDILMDGAIVVFWPLALVVLVVWCIEKAARWIFNVFGG